MTCFLWLQITAFADVHSLTIPEVFDEDSGTYTVKAANRAGEASCLAKLTVEPPPEETMEKKKVSRREQVPHSPPEFGRLFHDVTAKPGDSVTFECTVTGSPKPKVRFAVPVTSIYIFHCTLSTLNDA